TPMPVAKDKGSNITYNVNSLVHTHPPSVLPSSVLAGSSSFCARPPIRLEFPTFGDSCKTAEVLNFIEQCENFLEIRPLPSLELIGTLSTVLNEPAQSWWKAEKAKVTDWQSFKRAFMVAFLSDDYLSKVEEKLRTLVQQPQQRLRDFAYDYRALCLKWKPEISEEEMSTVNTVEQLVKDCMGAKDYWQKVGTQGSRDKTKKSADRTNNKNLAGVTQAQPHPLTSLLVVPVKLNGQEMKVVLDTGSSYTLMQENLWKQLKEESPSVITSTPQRFIMAAGTIHQSRDLQKLQFMWHDQDATGAVLEMAQGRIHILPFPASQVPAGPVTSAQPHSLTAAKVNLYYALSPTGRLPKLMSFTPEVSQWDSDNQDELLKLIVAWPRTTLNILGKTSVVQHKITLTDDIPNKIIEQHVDQMLQDNIIEPSFSPWSSPVVPKPDGSYRLNSKTIPDAYPMPLIHDILESLEGASWFSALDLQSGREKTAFITTKGLFQFKSMPYGLRNSAATFQRGRSALRNATSSNVSSSFSAILTERGVEIDREKNRAVAEFPPPQDLKALQRFLGLAGWYHKFIPRFADIAAPLNHLKKKGVKWDDIGLGAILTQHTVEGEKVVAYASRTLTGAERNYSTSEKECLAVVWAVEKLAWAFNCPKTSSRLTCWTLRLQQFSFQVHHRKGCLNMGPDALSRVYEQPSNTAAPCLSITSHHATTLPHSLEEIAKAQRVDDTITHLQAGRQPRSVKEQPITFEELQGVWYRKIPLKSKGEKYQLVVPHSLIDNFLHYYHDNPLGGHPGQLKTLLKLLEVAWWPSVRKDVWAYVKGCEVCQKYKASNTKPSGFLQSSQITEPGHTLGMDLMGLFPTSKKKLNSYLLVVVDYYTKWVEIFPLRDAKMQKIVKILREEIFTRWGGPKVPGIRQGLTTSYHPQANLTERINRTVKTMIAAYVGQQHQTWDQWLPEFRYAINTAQQESTGKTPAELMLGRQVLGPSPDQPAYSLVERQNIMVEEVKSRMRMSQAKQAKYYNYSRKNAQFQPGDLVWLKTHPLSSASNKFSAKLAPKWEGPAEIKSKTGPINYTVCWGNPPKTDVINVVNLKQYYGRLPPTP
ncbi:hypothetical protein M9458_052779, partial [Cirrhinus mrigala]